jgi:transcriptional regulator with XRE-family HTH domain
MAQHIGLEIRKVLKKNGMTVSEFARRINSSRENAYSIFKRKSIDTELLQTISAVLGHDFFGKIQETNRRSVKISAEPEHPYTKPQHELQLLREDLLLLRKEVQELRERISRCELHKKK